MVRPHAIQLTKPDAGLKGRVIRRVFVGSVIEVELQLEGGKTW